MNEQLVKRFHSMQQVDLEGDQALKNQRGLNFEGLIHDVFDSEGTLIKRGYHTSTKKEEQIDGAVEIWHRIMLLEVKWVASNLAASDLFSFIGKIDNKFHGTLGVFISRNELSDNFISSLNRGRRQNVIVVHGKDIDCLFQEDGPSFSDYLEHCIKLLSYDNITHFPVEKYVQALANANSINHSKNQAAKDFVTKANHQTEKNEAKISDTYKSLDPEAQKEVIRYALLNYSRNLNGILPKYKNLGFENLGADFFTQFTPKSVEIKWTIDFYFNELLTKDYFGYIDLLHLYVPVYSTLTPAQRQRFETKLLLDFNIAFRDKTLGTEGDIALIAKELWDDFTVETQQKLKHFYLEIFTDNERLDTYFQKAFAYSLLVNGKITKDEIISWLTEKLKIISKDYNDTSIDNFWLLQEDLLDLFIGAYDSLAFYIGMDHWSFREYLKFLLENEVTSST